MKKCILLLALIIGGYCYSQTPQKDSLDSYELKLNAGYLIAGYPELIFEKTLTSETSIGISLAFAVADNINDQENRLFDFSVIPYYRVYFGDKPNADFFIETNAAIYSQKKREGSFLKNEKEGGTGFGLGFNVGKKYRTKNGWIGEFSFGLSRTLINADKVDLIYPRAGIIIGKAF
ncbi:DUF3575 domain-containing protein [Polaribacter tangerinus]|uniref:DUF3575 domain-containing protein n=1 Tax=Polaribacter tangerinus TaxID=1920034 RepID=UPI00130375C8|nr:DUF3575 domain-containing protein [Polaribacter tangerinus]